LFMHHLTSPFQRGPSEPKVLACFGEDQLVENELA